MDNKHFTPRNKLSLKEKLNMIKEMDRRNEERRKEFAKQQARNEKLFAMYERGEISKEEFLRYYKG